jgi:hypothetical protein
MSLEQAIDTLVSTYDSLDLVAMSQTVDAKEVYDALNNAKPDTAEYVVLGYLAKYNPYQPPAKKAAAVPE